MVRPPDGMSDKEVLKIFLSSKDFACKNQFAFFDIPAGECSLSIAADGYEPHTTTVKVHPGEFIPPSPFRWIIK